MRIPITEVPLRLRRRAAQLLEGLRSVGEGLTKAMLAADVTPIHRSDMPGVAYYEFAIDRGNGKRSGYIMVSTGEHDYPHAHFSTMKQPVSDELLAKANDAARIYRCDAFGYVAVDARGRELARIRKLIGKTQRDQARKAWEIASRAEKLGEALPAGEPFRVALLEPGATFRKSGDAAQLVDVRRIDYRGRAAALELYARDVANGALSLEIIYPGGYAEALRFFVVCSEARGKPSRRAA